jgi:uncharacterized protein
MLFIDRIKGGKARCRTCIGLAAVISVVLFYGIWIEPDQVEVHHVGIHNSGLAKVLENRVVVLLSDLHIGKIGYREREVLEILEKLDPDLIFLTGDYVSWKGDYEAALNFLSLLHAKRGIWAVMGDYDYSSSRKSCLFCHEEGTVAPARRHAARFLRDARDLIRLPEGELIIIGVDGDHGLPGEPKKTFRPSDDLLPAIVLSHSPLSFDSVSDDRNILVLAGDTHGGQVPLPSGLFDALGYRKNALYGQGLFQKGQKQMFVSRGIGTSHMPLRLLRRPEVVVLHFLR